MGRRTDHRSAASRAAAERVLRLCDENNRVLGLGGGPSRAHPAIINLNIVQIDNVDIVGDAHRLPLAPSSIDAVHCEAVFEHLEDPGRAASELFRVMKSGSIGFICTPFLQAFHAYPSHYQNFTHLGQCKLFERAGFRILEVGTCVGPAEAVADIVAAFIAEYPPRFIRWPARAIWYAMSHTMLRPLDRWLSSRKNSYVVASTTYVLIAKGTASAAEIRSEQVPSDTRRA
jgi:ubiquinone/menaquinone biosynthesis C-methylase UbiE